MAEDPDDQFSRTLPGGPTEFGTAKAPDQPSQTFADFQAEPVSVRATIYAGISSAMLSDLDGVPDDALSLWGWGFSRDQEARDYAETQPALAPFFGNAGGYQVAEWIHQQDPRAGRLIMGPGTAEREGWQLPVSTVLAIVALKGAGAIGAASAAPSLGALGIGEVAGVGSLASTLSAAKLAVLTVGARIAGVPLAVAVAKGFGKAFAYGSAATIATGTVGGLILSPLSNYLDPDGNASQEEMQGVVAEAQLYDQSVATQGSPMPNFQNQAFASVPGYGSMQIPLPDFASFGGEGITALGAGPTAQETPTPPGSDLPTGDDIQDFDTFSEGDLDDTLALDADEEAEANAGDDPLLRVPQNFFGQWDDFKQPLRKVTRKNQPGIQIPQGYTQNDVQEVLNNLSIGQLIRLQMLGVRAGLLTEENVLRGQRSVATEDVLATFMGQANIDFDPMSKYTFSFWNTGEAMAIAGDEAKAAAEQADIDARPKYTRRPLMKLDPAFINEEIDRAADQKLGRKMNDWERTLLMQEYQQANTQRHAAEEQAGESYFNAQYRAIDTGETQGAGTFQAVDPGAQFAQRFDGIFENELDRRDRTEQVRSMTGNLMQGLSNAEAAVNR